MKVKTLFEQKGRYAVSINGYRLDRRLFYAWAAAVTVYVLACFSYLQANGGFYLSCPNEGQPCLNPYYHNCKDISKATRQDYSFLCEQELLTPGEEYGRPLPWPVEALPLLFFASLVLAFIINHYWHNKDKDLLEGD